jgi:hypothetical protein
MEKVEKDVFSTKDEFFRFEQIAESSYFWILIALIIAVIFCLFLFRIIWSWNGPPTSIKDSIAIVIFLARENTLDQYQKHIFSPMITLSVISDCRLGEVANQKNHKAFKFYFEYPLSVENC